MKRKNPWIQNTKGRTNTPALLEELYQSALSTPHQTRIWKPFTAERKKLSHAFAVPPWLLITPPSAPALTLSNSSLSGLLSPLDPSVLAVRIVGLLDCVCVFCAINAALISRAKRILKFTAVQCALLNTVENVQWRLSGNRAVEDKLCWYLSSDIHRKSHYYILT